MLLLVVVERGGEGTLLEESAGRGGEMDPLLLLLERSGGKRYLTDDLGLGSSGTELYCTDANSMELFEELEEEVWDWDWVWD